MSCLLGAPLGRLEDRGGLHAEMGGERPAGAPEDGHPQVGDPRPGALHRHRAAAAGEDLGRDADRPADASHEGLDRHSGWAGGVSASMACRNWSTNSLLPRIRSSLVYASRPRRSAVTACQPPRLRSNPPPSNSGRRPWGIPAATKAR